MTPSTKISGSPFKGLAPFEDSDLDALLFFGRARETETIAANLQATRLTVLFGPVGVGKTSVLRAGVAHRLRREDGVSVAIVDVWSGNARAALRSIVDGHPGGELYLILDQFEEYFLYHGDDEALASELAELLARPGLRMNVLVGIREDALARLDVFKRHLPRLLGNRLRLDRLDRRAAEEAIRGPIDAYNAAVEPAERVEIEPRLVEAILDEVAVGRVQLGGTGRGGVENGASADRIEAPFLQLVLERLWEAEREEGSPRMRLDTFRRLGGASSIVRDHLEHAMAGLSADEREAAAAMYHHLVTPSGTKIAHGVGDLAGYAGLDEAQALLVLGKLARERIVRGSSEDGPTTARYEIFHDVLADAVLDWRTRHQAQRALDEAERRRRRAHRVAAASLIALAVVAGVAVFALIERSHARTQERRARAGELAAGASLNLSHDPQRSLQLALAAARLSPSPSIENVLRLGLLHSELRKVMRGGPGGVNRAVVSPDGRSIVSAGEGGQARVLSIDGRLLHILPHDGAVTDVAFSPDGKRIATASRDRTVRVWSASSGRRLLVLRHTAPVTSVSFSPDGTRIVSGTLDGTAGVWDARGGQSLAEMRSPTAVRAAFFSPRGDAVLVVDHDRAARLFSATNGRELAVLQQAGFVNGAAFSPNGKLIATASNDRTGVLWSAATGQRIGRLTGAYGPLESISFSRNGALIVLSSDDGVARIYSVPEIERGFLAVTGGRISQLVGHTHFVTSALFSNDGKFVVTASSDGTARVWEVVTGRLVSLLSGDTDAVTSAVFTPDGRHVVTASRDGTVRVWNSGTEDELRVIGRDHGPVVSAAFSPDGRFIVSAGTDRTARVRDARTGSLQRTLVHPARVLAADFVLGDRYVVTAADQVRLWDAQAGRVVRAVHGLLGPRFLAAGPRGFFAASDRAGTIAIGRAPTANARLIKESVPVTALAFGSDASVLAAGRPDGAVELFRTADGVRLRSFRAHRGSVTALAFSPDGRLLATGGADRRAEIWQVASGRRIQVLLGHRGGITSVAFSPDGGLLVTGSLDADARTWSVANGQPLHRLHAHFGLVRSATFSPDGRWIVTAGPVTAGLWAAKTGTLLTFLRGHKIALRTAVFGPDSRTILTAGDDGTVRIYDCRVCGALRELVRLAESRLAEAKPR